MHKDKRWAYLPGPCRVKHRRKLHVYFLTFIFHWFINMPSRGKYLSVFCTPSLWPSRGSLSWHPWADIQRGVALDLTKIGIAPLKWDYFKKAESFSVLFPHALQWGTVETKHWLYYLRFTCAIFKVPQNSTMKILPRGKKKIINQIINLMPTTRFKQLT